MSRVGVPGPGGPYCLGLPLGAALELVFLDWFSLTLSLSCSPWRGGGRGNCIHLGGLIFPIQSSLLYLAVPIPPPLPSTHPPTSRAHFNLSTFFILPYLLVPSLSLHTSRSYPTLIIRSIKPCLGFLSIYCIEKRIVPMQSFKGCSLHNFEIPSLGGYQLKICRLLLLNIPKTSSASLDDIYANITYNM